LADGIATPPTNNPAAANNATRLADFNSPPICNQSTKCSCRAAEFKRGYSGGYGELGRT
jgi:hypothetical protein